MQVELPPVEMVDVEGEVVIFSTIPRVGQDVAATFGEAKKDMAETTEL